MTSTKTEQKRRPNATCHKSNTQVRCLVFAGYHTWFGTKTVNDSIETDERHITQGQKKKGNQRLKTPSSVGRRNSTRVDERKKHLKSSRYKKERVYRNWGKRACIVTPELSYV